jgi:hypothetical protein
MYLQRRQLYTQLEGLRSSKVISYFTGDRPGLETQIASEVYDFFVNHLDSIGVTKKISLYLYTRGGETLAAWSIVNLIKQFCDELEVIVPSKARSAGTLICLGANRIVMTKQATLGPIDPSINGPLNPLIPGATIGAKAPVSVEALNGFLELAQGQLQIKSPTDLSSILIKLSDLIHPLVIGDAYRSKSQIQMLAQKLIESHTKDGPKSKKIINFLCSESGSHDYAIHRREARELLGLNIEKPDDQLYALVKSIYDDIAAEIQLNSRFDPAAMLGNNPSQDYSLKRGLIESVGGGSHYYVSEGTISATQLQTPQGVQRGLQDQRRLDGWKHEPVRT